VRALLECWWRTARGKSHQAAEYCKKDGDVYEQGTCPGPQDKANTQLERYESALTAAKAGEWDDIPADLMIKHYHALKDINRDFMDAPADLDGPCGVWIYGPPGVGKSYKARDDYRRAYLKPQNKWWDGFQSDKHAYVIIDDFDKGGVCLGHYLKIWADAYAFVAEVKGSSMPIRPAVICVTSNYSIEELFGDDAHMCSAIRRRFRVIHMSERWNVRRPRVAGPDERAVAALRLADTDEDRDMDEAGTPDQAADARAAADAIRFM